MFRFVLPDPRVTVAAVTLLLVTTMPTAAQPAATPAASCPAPHVSPAAHLATPASATPAARNAVDDVADLQAALRACGVRAEDTGTIQQPFLQPNGTTLHLRGGTLSQPADVQVFAYDTPQAADTDAAQIGPDGNPRTTMVTWIAPPHFFRADRLIVLYIGDDQAVVDLLTALLGPPFAGG